MSRVLGQTAGKDRYESEPFSTRVGGMSPSHCENTGSSSVGSANDFRHLARRSFGRVQNRSNIQFFRPDRAARLGGIGTEPPAASPVSPAPPQITHPRPRGRALPPAEPG